MASRIGTAIHNGIENAWLNNYRLAMAAIGLPQSVIDRVRINPKPTDMPEDAIPIYLEQRLSRQLGKWTVTGAFDFVSEGRVQDFKSTSVWAYQKQVNTEKFAKQGSIYRWLGSNIITADELDIHWIFTDWKGAMFKSDTAYPPRRFLTQRIPLLTLGDTEHLITTKLAQIDQYWNTDEADLPLCTDEELWRSEPVFKYYKNPEKTSRSTKNFDTMQDAYVRMAEDNNVGIVKEVPGMVTACKYCPAFAVCSQKDSLIASGDLIL